MRSAAQTLNGEVVRAEVGFEPWETELGCSI
jgi:hypothetical protein